MGRCVYGLGNTATKGQKEEGWDSPARICLASVVIGAKIVLPFGTRTDWQVSSALMLWPLHLVTVPLTKKWRYGGVPHCWYLHPGLPTYHGSPSLRKRESLCPLMIRQLPYTLQAQEYPDLKGRVFV